MSRGWREALEARVQRLRVDSDDADTVRRGQLFIAICVVFFLSTLASMPLVAWIEEPSYQRILLLLFMGSLGLYPVGGVFARRGHVDVAAFLVGSAQSVLFMWGNVNLGGDHDMLWLMPLGILVGSTGVRAPFIAGLWVVNIGLAALVIALFPGVMFGDASNPVRFLTFVSFATVIALASFAQARSHQRSFAQSVLARREIELKKAEAERAKARALQARLETEQALARAEAASRAKSQFLANMSHELRTPLNAIIGYAELIQEEADEISLEEALPDLARIQGSAQHLLTIISDVLDLSRIEAGKISLSASDLSVEALVHDVVDVVEPLARANHNTLEVALSHAREVMCSDRVRLRQILLNLLSNAAKFTQAGEITVRVADAELGGAPALRFEVQDTGIGIGEDALERIFELFEQEDASTTREYGGTGIGLALSRRLAEMLGGTLEAASVEGVGSTFTLLVPVVWSPDEGEERELSA